MQASKMLNQMYPVPGVTMTTKSAINMKKLQISSERRTMIQRSRHNQKTM